MPVAFETTDVTDFGDLPGVETAVRERFEVESSDDSETEGDEASAVSLSDYQADVGEAPAWAWLGSKECRALFELVSDKKLMIGARCCGRGLDSCGRSNHGNLSKGPVGWYKTVASKKYVDGVASTYLTDGQYRAKEAARKGQAKDALMELARDLESPSRSKKVPYAEPERKPAGSLKPEAVKREGAGEDLAGMWKTPTRESGEDGYSKSPTMAAVRMAGAEPNLMPALAGMLDTLTLSVNKMSERVAALEVKRESFGQAQGSGKGLSGGEEEMMERTESGTKRHWYGVTNGKDGSKVYPDWGIAGAMVTGKSGASSKKFGSKKEAEGFVRSYLRATANTLGFYCFWDPETGNQEVVSRWEDGGPMRTARGVISSYFDNEEEAFQWLAEQRNGQSLSQVAAAASAAAIAGADRPTAKITPIKQDNPKARAEPMFLPPIGTKESRVVYDSDEYGPPSRFFGADESTGEEERVFGIDLNGTEEELREELCPPGMSENIGVGLSNAVVDVVGQTGGYKLGEKDEAASDSDIIGEALQELVHQGRGSQIGGREDLQWSSKKRVSIRTIKDLNGLRKATRVLTKLRRKVYRRMIKASAAACKRNGWIDSQRIEMWATGGALTKIIMATLEAYLSLHQHWLEMTEVDGASWGYVKMEVEYHTEELELIRETSEHRLQALCLNYVHLRDGLHGNWYYAAIQNKRNLKFMGLDDTSTMSETGGPGNCPKCGTGLHDGGRAECPWHNKTDEEALSCGKDALRNLSQKKKKI